MPMAYMLINTEEEFSGKILGELRKIDGVENVYLVRGRGPFNIVAQVKTEAIAGLSEINSRARKMAKILLTETLIVTEET